MGSKQILYCQALAFFMGSILFSMPNIAHADYEDDSVGFFNNEIPIVLSATRLAQPQTEAPATITIIDRQMIKLSGAKEIPEIFRLVPGMHVNYFRGNRAVVGYQGINSEYPQGVQVLIDGRSVYNPSFGGIDWANFPLTIEDIERIEVIRGANSTSFGSNAFQSVINITTSHANQSNGFQAKSTLGERGYQRTFLKSGYSFSDLDIRVSASHTDNNGYQHKFDDRRQDLFSSRLDYRINTHNTLQLNAAAVNTLRETADPSNTLNPLDPRRQQDETHFSLHGKWEHNSHTDQLFVTQLSYTRFNSKDNVTSNLILPPHGAVTYSADYTATYDRWDFEFEHQLKLSNSMRGTWGIGLRADRITLPFWTGTDSKHDNSLQRLFSNLEWRPTDALIFNIGGLWEHSQLVGDDFSPRVALNYLLTPQQSIRFVASHAFRSPVIVENNFETDLVFETGGGELRSPYFRNISNLEPETVDSLELGYHGLYFDNALTLDLKLFRNEYKHIIETLVCTVCDATTLNGFPSAQIPALPIVQTLDNLYSADINGYEVEINYKPTRKSLLHIGYAYNHSNSNALIKQSVPRETFNLLLGHSFMSNYWASFAYYHTGSMDNLGSGDALGPMRRFDLNAGKSFNVADQQTLEINVNLQLALDKNADLINGFNLDNRFFVEANYSFN